LLSEARCENCPQEASTFKRSKYCDVDNMQLVTVDADTHNPARIKNLTVHPAGICFRTPWDREDSCYVSDSFHGQQKEVISVGKTC
jgi:hypothetical protein